MTEKRKHYSPGQKMTILKRHLLEKTPVSDLSDEHGVHPTMVLRWQKSLFEDGSIVFEPKSSSKVKSLEKQVADLEEQLRHKNEVMVELMEEYVRSKKKLGER
ncbi:MAG: transposase [Magnetococcales bacterium]|nr:transposase [Magnetococcales bacterium]